VLKGVKIELQYFVVLKFCQAIFFHLECKTLRSRETLVPLSVQCRYVMVYRNWLCKPLYSRSRLQAPVQHSQGTIL
jgi:hypothetical protein